MQTAYLLRKLVYLKAPLLTNNSCRTGKDRGFTSDRKRPPILVACHAQELILSENKLQEIPATLAGLKALRILRLQNNKLKTLPHSLGAVITLEELDCVGNADLDIVPPPLHSDTAMILWVCRLHEGGEPNIVCSIRTR